MLEASMNNQGEVEDEELIENVTSVTYAGILCSFLAPITTTLTSTYLPSWL